MDVDIIQGLLDLGKAFEIVLKSRNDQHNGNGSFEQFNLSL